MQESQVTAVSGQRRAATRRRSFSLSSPTSGLSPLASARSGFTLTELLIVIAIIAILAGLIAAAAVNALRRGRVTGIQLEIKNLATAVENFKNEAGVYPPNGMNADPGNTATGKLVQSDWQRAFAKMFQGNSEPALLAAALCGQNTGGPTSENLQGGMTAPEAIYFWLGGFSSDKKFPISGPGGPSYPVTGPDANIEVMEDRTGGYEFDRGRLGPRDGETFSGRFIEYQVDLNQNGNTTDPGERRRINFWRYNPKGSEQPLAYFDTSRHKPYQYDPQAGSGTTISAIKRVREGLTTPTSLRDIAYVDGKYQILHCGLDDDWGDFGPSVTRLPTPPTVGDLEPYLFPNGVYIGPIADTLTNFTDSELADESEQ